MRSLLLLMILAAGGAAKTLRVTECGNYAALICKTCGDTSEACRQVRERNKACYDDRDCDEKGCEAASRTARKVDEDVRRTMFCGAGDQPANKNPEKGFFD